MKTVFVGDDSKITEDEKKLVDFHCENLLDFAGQVRE